MKPHHTTREGMSIPIAEMTDSHLQNTIAAKERWWREQIRPYVEEAEKRGVKPLPLWKKVWYWIKRKFDMTAKNDQLRLEHEYMN